MFTKRVDKMAGAVYRLNLDAAFVFRNQELCSHIVSYDWEYRRPTRLPCILRLSAGNSWGVVFAFPHVLECTSLLAAHTVLKEELLKRGLEPEIVLEPAGKFPAKTIKLASC